MRKSCTFSNPETKRMVDAFEHPVYFSGAKETSTGSVMKTSSSYFATMHFEKTENGT
jgi:hypothetical protein